MLEFGSYMDELALHWQDASAADIVRWRSAPSSLEKKKAADASPRGPRADHFSATGIGK